MTALLVAVGGALGAVLRLLLGHVTRARFGDRMPWGTLCVNVAGSLALGLLVGAASVTAVPDDVVAALGIGLCGAFTTWSTAAWDAVVLAPRGGRLALAWTAGEVTAGLLAAAGGWAVAVALLAT